MPYSTNFLWQFCIFTQNPRDSVTNILQDTERVGKEANYLYIQELTEYRKVERDAN